MNRHRYKATGSMPPGADCLDCGAPEGHPTHDVTLHQLYERRDAVGKQLSELQALHKDLHAAIRARTPQMGNAFVLKNKETEEFGEVINVMGDVVDFRITTPDGDESVWRHRISVDWEGVLEQWEPMPEEKKDAIQNSRLLTTLALFKEGRDPIKGIFDKMLEYIASGIVEVWGKKYRVLAMTDGGGRASPIDAWVRYAKLGLDAPFAKVYKVTECTQK